MTLPLTSRNVSGFRRRLLNWYDAHRRELPWRAPPGQAADPYHVWLSEIMLQQTTVAAVTPYFQKFLARWPDVHALAEAENADIMAAWAGLGYYARARNLHKCAQAVSQTLAGKFPVKQSALKNLPGIGDYTSAAITSIAFDQPATVIDGNVERVIARWAGITTPLPAAKSEIRAVALALSEGRDDRPGDFAQAMMDLGATVCRPRSPDCVSCPLRNDCVARAAGQAEVFPIRAPKKAKPVKFGQVYWLRNKRGEILVEQRPANKMLGGMLGLPTSEWTSRNAGKRPPDPSFIKSGRNAVALGIVEHSFTHFDLELEVIKSDAALSYPAGYLWISEKDIKTQGWPSLFAKCVGLATV